jgi:hypothetical protein
MLTKEFNKLPLAERRKLVFGEGKLIGIIQEHDIKALFYKLNDLKIDVIYDMVLNTLQDITAWESIADRVISQKVPAKLS